MHHPMQPIEKKDGVIRFKENAIVRFLLDAGPNDLNSIALMSFSVDDHRQLAQLIGYSVSGYGDLNYCEGHWSVAAADEAADTLT